MVGCRVGGGINSDSAVTIHLCLRRRYARETCLTRTVLHFQAYVLKFRDILDQCFVVFRRLRVVGHHRDDRRQVARPDSPDMQIGYTIVRVGFDQPMHSLNQQRINRAVEENGAGIAQQPP